MKNYSKLFRLFYGDYTEDYCNANGLFIEYTTDGKLKHITKSLVDYAFEIIATDLNLILGNRFDIQVSNSESADNFLQEWLKQNNSTTLFRLFILQGLILGDSALKIGRDENSDIKMGLVRFLDGSLSYTLQNGQITQWVYSYTQIIDKRTVVVKEIYTLNEIIIMHDDKIISTTPNRYGELWLKHVANTPSLKDPVFGDSELARIGDTIDEMNSTLARISSIEDIYAKPRLIVSGLRNVDNLKKEYNLWSMPDTADVKILEYHGNIIPAMLDKYDRLENYLRNKCPELILNDLGNISGYALKLKLSKLIKKIDNYRFGYFRAIKEALGLVLKMAGYNNVDIVINTGPVIPADEVEDVNKWTKLLAADIVSRETVATALGYDFQEEQQKITDEMAWLSGLNGGGLNDQSGTV